MKLPIYQIDAFASEPFRGNPAAVVPLQRWLPDVMLQAIAEENNLAETAFFVAANNDAFDFELRWFTPSVEIDLCGHATLAVAHVLSQHLGDERAEFRFSTQSGVVRTLKRDNGFALDFPSRPGTRIDAGPMLAEALGVEPCSVYASRDWVVLLDEEAKVRNLKPNMSLIAELPTFAVCVTSKAAEPYDFVCRFFAPGAGVPEDPATGSVYCTLAPLWSELLGKRRLQAFQAAKRGAHVTTELAGDRVLISGETVTYMTGQIVVPDPLD